MDMSPIWTEEMDALLLKRRRDQGLPWRSVAPIGGMGERRCQKRFGFLTSGAARPSVRVAEPEPDTSPRDGLAWLVRKNRVTPDQAKAGLAYRAAYVDGGEVSLRSCLDVRVGGGEAIGSALLSHTAAKRELFVMRHVVLRGQVDMLTVVDGVCGSGWTLRDLAKGEQTRAREMEAVLRVALDLLAGHRAGKRGP